MPSSKRFVVLLKGFIGDAVMATPLIEGLRMQGSTWVAAPPHIADVLGESWRDTFCPVVGKGLLPRAKALRAANADIAFVLNRSFRSALAAKAAGIKVRVGHDAERRGFLLTHRVPFDWQRHETESYLALAAAVGLDLPSSNPKLLVTDEERSAGASVLRGAKVVLQPGARHEYKRLRTETLAELVPLLRKAGLEPVLIGGNDELESAEQLQAAVPDLRSVVGQTTMRQTLGLLSAAELAIGADTGVMHLAAAVDCPTVTVFGPTEFASRWGHLYTPHQIIQAPPEGMAQIRAKDMFEAGLKALDQLAVVPTSKP